MVVPEQIWCCETRSAAFVEVFRRSATAAGYDVRLFAPGAETPADFAEFARNYVHLSSNSVEFELAAYRRWFEVRDRVAASTARFIMADSDLFVQAGPAELPAGLTGAPGIVGSIGTTDRVAETAVSPHFSFWTPELIASFCAFIVAAYRDTPERLRTIHAARVAVGMPLAVVTDMTLLHLWLGDSGTPFTDSNRIIGGLHIDHNIGMADCATARFRMSFGHKALTFDSGKVWLTTAQGERVRPAILHFVGRNKLYAPAVAAGRPVEVAARSLAIATGRRVSRWLRP